MAKKRKNKTAKAQEPAGDGNVNHEDSVQVPDQPDQKDTKEDQKEDTETDNQADDKTGDVDDKTGDADDKTDVTEDQVDDKDDNDKDTDKAESTAQSEDTSEDQPNLFSLADEDDSDDEPSEPVPAKPAKTVDEPEPKSEISSALLKSSSASIKSSSAKSSTSAKDRSEVTVPSAGDSDSSDSEMEFPKVVSDPPRPSTPTTTSQAEDPDQTPVARGQRSPHVTMDSAASLSTPTDYERVYRRRNTATSTRSRMTVRVDTGDLHSQSPTPSSNGISIDTFLDQKELSFRLVTWNVHNRAPPVIEDEHLDSLFLPQSDITVLALQEADPVSGLVSTAQTLNGWKAAVLETLEKANEDGDVKDETVVTAKEVDEEVDDKTEKSDESGKSEKKEESEKKSDKEKNDKSDKSTSSEQDESVKTDENEDSAKTEQSSESGYESSASGYESSASNNHAYYDPYSNYVVSSNQLIGLLIIVIARKSLMSQISDVRVKSAGTGLLGVWGNKGAVLVEMHIGREATSTQSSKGGFFVPGTRVCFLNCHLSAGDNNVVRRRWEIDQMYRRLELPGRPEWYAKVKENKDGTTSNSSTASLAADNAKYAEYNASSEFLGNSTESSESDADENESIRGPFSAATTITEMSPNLNGRGGFDDAESVVSADSRAGAGVFDWSADAAAAGAGGAQRLSRPHENSNLSVVSEAECASSPQGDPRTIIFFLGDLNYRVDKTHEEALEMIEKNDFAGLLAHDQLLKDTRDGRVLAGLNEYPINFPPTYKYVENTVSELDTLRTPSYTDRILSRAWGGCELVQKGYHSHMEYTNSDHKPVSAEFSLSLPLIDFDKRAQIVNNYLKSVGVQENLDRPAVTVSPMSLRVQLAVLTTQTVPLVIHNTGHTVAHWEISQTSGFDDDGKDKKNASSPSITLSSTTGQLLPGDQEIVEVTFSAAIGAPSCDSFAIVHVRDSKDIFVDTGYDVLPSCFGSDLDYLSRLPNGARNGLSEDGKVVSNMPQEIWKCVDYLWSVVDRDGEGGEDGDRSARPSIEKPGTTTAPRDSRESPKSPLVGLFTSPGDPHLEMDIRDWLDTGSSFNVESLNDNPLGPQSVASQLHLLLASLSQRIIPEYAYLSVPEKTIAAGTGSRIPFMGGGVDNTADVAAHILEAVPNVNANVMIYICSFIRLLVDRKAMTLKTALDVFAPLLMDSPKQGGVSKVWKKSPISSAKLLQHMIDTY